MTQRTRRIKPKKKNKMNKILNYLIKFILSLLFIGIFVGIMILSYFFLTTEKISDANFWQSKNITEFYDRNNELIQNFGKNIKYVKLDNVSEYYIDGLLTTEDANFYKHSGVSFLGMVRAFFQTLLTDSDSGGSTITMQLAKNIYLAPVEDLNKEGEVQYDENGNILYDYPYNNKIEYKLKQIVYAWKIEQKYTKEEILENYINYLEFAGPSVQGIENAAQYFFGVDAKHLSISQGATLAGMTQLPGAYNPYTNEEATTNRRNIVLNNMYKNKKITKEEYDTSVGEKIEDTLFNYNDSNNRFNEEYNIIRPYLDVIESEIKSEMGEDFDLNTAQAKIYTSLDMDLQKEVYNTINNKDNLFYYPDEKIQAGATVLDSETGEILAIGGGRLEDGKLPLQNYGALYKRQPGSISKPLVDYAPAIEYLNWSTGHILTDKVVTYTGGPAVSNAYDGYYGNMTIQEGLSRSSNTIALQTYQAVAQSIGNDGIANFLKSLGITDVAEMNEAYSIGGWHTGTTTLEMAGAYGALANGGIYNKPHAIKKIEFSKTSPYYGKYDESYEIEREEEQVMKASTAYMVTKMLDPSLYYSITKQGIVSGLNNQAIKTGTSNWDKNSYGIPKGGPRDKWVAGYTPDVTTIVWSGYDGNDEAQGYYFDSYGEWSFGIYTGIMKYIVNSPNTYLKDNTLTMPDNVYEYKVGGINYYMLKDSNEYKEVERRKAAEEQALKEAEAAAKKEAEEQAKKEAIEQALKEAESEEEKEDDLNTSDSSTDSTD